ncbi:MAG: hypothetical protein AB2L22_11770 [Syntrophales bacterium]
MMMVVIDCDPVMTRMNGHHSVTMTHRMKTDQSMDDIHPVPAGIGEPWKNSPAGLLIKRESPISHPLRVRTAASFGMRHSGA